MKILVSLSLILAFVFNNFAVAAPLVFKAKKEVLSDTEEVELGQLLTARFKQIKIQVLLKGNRNSTPVEREDYERKLRAGQIWLLIEGVEGDERIPIEYVNNQTMTKIIDLPPSKIRVVAKGKGDYRLFIWAI